MRIFNKINKMVKRLPKRVTVLAAAFIVVAVPLTVKAAWGPARPTFDYNKFDASKSCTDPANAGGRCGSLTGPVFNSFIHTPSYGDERNFVTTSQAGKALWTDSVNGVTSGEEVEVRVFFHNNANQTYNDEAHGYKGIATNTRVRVYIPTGQANGFDVAGYVSADNAKPVRVYDTATLSNSNTAFSLSYVPGSAKLYNNGPFKNGVALSDDVVGANGAQIGYQVKNGRLPGCFNYEGVVIVKLKVNTPKLLVSKTVSRVEKPKLVDTAETLNVNRGEAITWRIDYKNNGTDVLNHIVLRDALPKGLTLVPGSITWVDAARPTGQTLRDDALSGNGVDLGNYAPNGNGLIRFRTTVDQNVDSCEITNMAIGRGTNVPDTSDTAKIVINDCSHVTPSYSCNFLTAELVSGKTYKFTVNASAVSGATIQNYTYDFGDKTTLLTNKTSVQHTYKPGSYLAKVTVNVRVNGSDKTVTSAQCNAPIKVTVHPKTPPAELVNTGPGQMLGIFAATTLAGAMLYRLRTLHKFNQ